MERAQLPVQSSSLSHSGELQLPWAQSKTHLAPASHLALGQTEPPLVQVKLQIESFWQTTARLAQLPDWLQLKSQVLPAPQVAVPLQVLPPPLHEKSHSAPG